MRNAAVTPQLQLFLIIIIVCWRLWKPQTVTSSELNVQSTPDNSNPYQLEPRANSNKKIDFPWISFIHLQTIIVPSVTHLISLFPVVCSKRPIPTSR